MNENKLKEELLFALKNRDSATLVCIAIPNINKRIEIRKFLKDSLTEYKFHQVNLTTKKIQSLHEVLNRTLPAEIKNSNPVEYIVEVTGIENSLYQSKDGVLKYTELINELNFERELLFSSVPYITILWCNQSFFNILQKEAPDLWSWITYRFNFCGESENKSLINFPLLHVPDIDKNYEFDYEEGLTEEREKRIIEYTRTLQNLSLDTNDYKRSAEDKANLRILLGIEYLQINDYNKSQTNLLEAQAIAEKNELFSKQVQALFYLSRILEEKHEFEKAIKLYLTTIKVAEKNKLTSFYPSIYFNLGRLNHLLDLYDESLKWFNKVLEWEERYNESYKDIEPVYFNISNIYLQKKDIENARKYIVRGKLLAAHFENKKYMLQFDFLLAYLYYYIEDYQLAFKIFEGINANEFESIQDYDTFYVYKYYMAMCYLKLERWHDAILKFENLLSKFPDYDNVCVIFYYTGYCFEQLGDIEKAKQNYKRAYDNIGELPDSIIEVEQIKKVYEHYFSNKVE